MRFLFRLAVLALAAVRRQGAVRPLRTQGRRAARSRSAGVLDTAKGAARDVSGHAKDAAAQVVDDAKQRAGDVKRPGPGRGRLDLRRHADGRCRGRELKQRARPVRLERAPDRRREAVGRLHHRVVPDVVEQLERRVGARPVQAVAMSTTAIGSSTPHTMPSGDGCVSIAPVYRL